MDELNLKAFCRGIAEKYAAQTPPPGIESQLVLDEARGQYLLIYNGWQGAKRVHGPALHLEVRGNKIWIHFDGVGDSVADELTELGVLPEHIVLAWQHPSRRKLTPFAVA